MYVRMYEVYEGRYRYEVYAMLHVQKLPTTCSAHFVYPVQLYIYNAYMYSFFYIYVHMH